MMSMPSLLLLFATSLVKAAGDPSPFLFGASSNAPHATKAALLAFGEKKLGMFMHDGPVTQWGSSISWPLVCMKLPCTVQTKRRPGDTTPTTRNITTLAELKEHRQQYRDLAKTYNPKDFNATHIAVAAKAAGFKYLVYTTVHCDGFANWDSQVTGYNEDALREGHLWRARDRASQGRIGCRGLHLPHFVE